MRAAALISLVTIMLAGCGGGDESGASSLEPGPTVAGFRFVDTPDVADGQPISPHIGCGGEGVSPELAWSGVPDGTRELALVLEDPDAPGGTFTHWLVDGIDPAATKLHGADPAHEGTNDFGNRGYGAPCPPPGLEHHYMFRLFALSEPVDLEPGFGSAEFDVAVSPHVLAEARLTATYVRQ